MDNSQFELVVYAAIIVAIILIVLLVYVLWNRPRRRAVFKQLAVYASNAELRAELLCMSIPEFLTVLERFLNEYTNGTSTEIPFEIMIEVLKDKRDLLAQKYYRGNMAVKRQLNSMAESIRALADFIVSQANTAVTRKRRLKRLKHFLGEIAEVLKKEAADPKAFFTNVDPATQRTGFQHTKFILERELKKAHARSLKSAIWSKLKQLAENFGILGKLEKDQQERQDDVNLWKDFGQQHKEDIEEAFGKGFFDNPEWPNYTPDWPDNLD
jgi:hypothetical protein